jgi:uncharacterized protein involved in exopolysaccharide biosynthesis
VLRGDVRARRAGHDPHAAPLHRDDARAGRPPVADPAPSPEQRHQPRRRRSSDHAALTFVGTQTTALHSRDLAERVVTSYGLASSPAFLEPAKYRSGPLPVAHDVQPLFRPRGLGAGPARAAGNGGSGLVDPELLDRYMKYLSVKNVQGTDLIDVSFVTPSPTLSAFLAAAHTQAYLEANVDARHATDVMAQGFLGRKLAAARKKVKVAEASLDRFAERHPDVAVDQEHRVGGQRIAELSSLLTRAEAARVGLESRYEFLTSRDADPLAYFLDSPGWRSSAWRSSTCARSAPASTNVSAKTIRACSS